MKKPLTAILISLFLITGAWAAGKGWVKQSTQKTADAAITTSGGLFIGIMVIPPTSTNSVTINIYDNATAASGSKLIPTVIIYAVASSVYTVPYTVIKPPGPTRFYNGLYVDITSSGSVKYMVYWEND